VVIRDRVRMSVSDDGPGIPTSELDRIFEPFFTTKEEGTGLGLSLSRKIIRDNGGNIWVSSTRLFGATFTIELPLLIDDSTVEDPSSSDEFGMTGANRSVLVVDDEDHITELVESILQLCGYRTDRINDGAPAVELMRKKDYDILICDLHMPGMNGRDLIRWVRSNKPNVRILLLTGDITGNDVPEFVKSHAAQLLAKPFTVSELLKAVQRLSS
jgi:CheY-like chemotaxis protein